MARGRLGARGLEGTQVIWRQQPKVEGPNHWGSRLVFRPDGTLFVTLGERFAYRERAQDLSTTLGKIVRINPDGSIPRDNPVRRPRRRAARDLVLRASQRPGRDARRRRGGCGRWSTARGRRRAEPPARPGKNYGWPVITYGLDYSGARIGIGTAKPGMEQPVYYWDPVIAPSGAIFYTGSAFPEWRGDLLVGSLTPGGLVRLRLDGRPGRPGGALPRASSASASATCAQGPDGALYLLTDEPRGRIFRLEPIGR